MWSYRESGLRILRRGLWLQLDCKDFLLLSVPFLPDHGQSLRAIEGPPFDPVFEGDHFGPRTTLTAFLKVVALRGSLFLGKLFVNIEVEFLESHNSLS